MGGRRHVALLHALCFVAGFSLIFILLGASATALGRALNYYQVWLQRVGGVLIIAFGLVCLGVVKAGWLTQERRLHLEHKPVGYLGSALVGLAFGAGWTPCIGPVLGAILGLAATSADLSRGMLLLARLLRGAGDSVPDRRGRRGAVPRLVPAIPEVSAVGDAGERGAAGVGGDPAAHRSVHPAGRLAAGFHAGDPPQSDLTPHRRPVVVRGSHRHPSALPPFRPSRPYLSTYPRA